MLAGRDVIMQVTHESAFEQLLEQASALLPTVDGWENPDALVPKGKSFTAADFGCGNGWAVRKMASVRTQPPKPETSNPKP